MKSKSNLPRITQALRVFSEVAANHDLQETEEHQLLGKKRKLKAKNNAQSNYPKWENLKRAFYGECFAPDSEIKAGVRELLEFAKEMVGSESSKEIIEGTAAYLFEMLCNCETVSQKQVIRLRKTFGTFPTSVVYKALKLINKMYSWLSEESQNKLFMAEKKTVNDLMELEFGHKIKFLGFHMLSDSELMHHLNEDINDSESNLSFSLEYIKEQNRNEEPKPAPIREPHSGRHELSWLEKTIKQYYGQRDKNPLGMSVSNIVTYLTSLLKSSKSNDALQADLFDYLGYEKLELIEILLKNRQEVTTSRATDPIEVPLSSAPVIGDQRPNYGCQVIIQSEQEKEIKKQLRKEERRVQREEAKMTKEGRIEEEFSFDPVALRKQREAELLRQVLVPLVKRPIARLQQMKYPFVFDLYAESKLTSAFIGGNKLVLPVGHQQVDNKKYQKVVVPASNTTQENMEHPLIPIDSLDEIGRQCFSGMKTLNRIQSIVFNTAYNTNENLLICAPTGGGKTNIAMLTMLHEIRQNMENNILRKEKFKIIYVAPMKSLAAEMVRNFSKRLEGIGIQVRELTGDIQLTKKEITQTQVIVTTPEKWDVVTRKATGDIALSQLVRLIILDEVHLLQGDRGPVLEAIVARTLRQVETSQSMIRLVGLSATVPNYLDVASFLCVNPFKGLFYFDGRYRPVPLGQTFIGIKANDPLQQLTDMDEVCYSKVLETVSKGQQVMVFVHTRNSTVRTAMVLRDIARNKSEMHYFELQEKGAQYLQAEKQMLKSRNKQLRELFTSGFAIHHAGMLRTDRMLVEKFFYEGIIKVLVCTSTLAWGVNLPAHAVIIRGTEIYDSKYGRFVDLDILDVTQIFGRAGRPQFDKYGEGTIITTFDKLHYYLSLLTSQLPIESKFDEHLVDNLNAEISLGTVTTVEESLEWLRYTYFYIRMRCNPLSYGLKYNAEQTDPNLAQHCKSLIEKAAMDLDKAEMIRFNPQTGIFSATEMGRTASHFYIKYDTIMIFNELLKPEMTEENILELVSQAQEFSQLKAREDEMMELDHLHENVCHVVAKGGSENTHGKVNILIQSHISRAKIDSFSLLSDQSFVIQNATRIIRALFEITLRKNMAIMAGRLLKFSKILERQLWDFRSPLNQFAADLSYEVLDKIEKKILSVDKIKDMTVDEVGNFVHHKRMGATIKLCANYLPCVQIDASIQPITRTVIRVRIDITPDFKWNDKIHGTAEAFWVWIEEPFSNNIYHSEYFLLTKKQTIRKETQSLVFTIPVVEPLPSQYLLRVISDRWLGSEYMHAISFKHLILPDDHPPHTELLDLEPLPVSAVDDIYFESVYEFSHFNPIQTQIFHTLYHTDSNILLGAPTGSGKTIAAEIAMFRVFRVYPGTKVVYIAPLKALVRERIKDWKIRLEHKLGRNVVELTGDVTPDAQAIAAADVIVTTPEKWDGVSRSWQTRNYVQAVALIVIDEIHLLGEDRGPVLEVIVSRTNFISAHTDRRLRIIGLSTALANAKDLADWLGIKELGLYNFRPSVRPVPLETHISGFPGKHYCPRMALMNKPAYQAIITYSPTKPVLIFVSSRRQTRLTALDLIAYLARENNPRQWVNIQQDEMDQIIQNVRDQNLKLTLAFGIGLHHAGLHEKDRNITEELFVTQKIQVLVATATLAWGVNFPAHLVIVKGTEYYDGKVQRYVDFPITDVLQMIGRAGRPQFDDHGVAVVLVQDIKKAFYKKFLYEPFPVESSLLKVLADHLNAEIVAGTITTKQDCIDYITWTYFFRRLLRNPTYYSLETVDHGILNKYLSGLVDRSLAELECAHCVEIGEDNRSISSTVLGRIASYYYLNYKTVQMFQEKMSNTMSLEELLKVLTDVEEYQELPVRHNEDALNSDLAKYCPLDVDSYTFDSPHTKAHLLFQAHFSRLQLPCSDYYTDLKSVLDQAIRIIQAMIDVASDQGWLATSLQAMTLLQMVLQARWYNVSSLQTLPHIDNTNQYCFKNARTSCRQQRSKYYDGPIESLPELIASVRGKYDILANMLRRELDENQIEQVFDTLLKLPVVNVSVSIKGHWDDSSVERRVSVHIEKLSGKRPDHHWIPVHADKEYVLSLEFLREIKRRKNETKALAPKFPKQKEEGWFLVLGDIGTRELIAMKRIGYIADRSYHQLIFYTPEKLGHTMYTIFLISDCYLGLDQQYNICLNVVHPDQTSSCKEEKT